MRNTVVSVLTILIIIDGLGWTLGVLAPLYFAFSHRSLPTVGGIKLLAGPFEKLGLDAFMVAGLVFVVLNGLKLLAAYWVWKLRMDGVVLDLILLGLCIPFWYGFALPFGPSMATTQIVLIALTLKSFS